MEIFEIVSLLFTAYFSGALFIAGLVTTGLAGLILYAELKSDDQEIKAKIVGVRESQPSSTDEEGRVYYPVFEILDSHGMPKRLESRSGSSLLSNKVPGSSVRVKINEENPDWATPVGKTWIIIGIIIFLVGMGCFAGAWTLTESSLITWCVWALMGLWSIRKIRKIILPKDLRSAKKKFMKERKESDFETRTALPLIDEQGFRQLIRKQDKTQLVMSPLAILVACGIIYAGYHLQEQEQKFFADTNITTGTYDRTDKHFPKVTYTDDTGAHHEIYDEYSRIYPSTIMATTAKVHYKKANSEDAVVGRGIWQGLYWKLLMAFGAFMLVQTLVSVSKTRKRLSRI